MTPALTNRHALPAAFIDLGQEIAKLKAWQVGSADARQTSFTFFLSILVPLICFFARWGCYAVVTLTPRC